MAGPGLGVFCLLRVPLTSEEVEEVETGAGTALEIAREIPFEDWEIVHQWVES